MYFWKIESLKEDIKNGDLTEKDRFIYVLVYIVLCGVGIEAMVWMPIDNGNIWNVIDSILSILIVILGTICAYKANGAAIGYDFLGRYFSINFVVSIRFLVFLIPMFFLLNAYYSNAFSEDEEITSTALDTIPFIVWYAAIYWRIFKHMSDVKTPVN